MANPSMVIRVAASIDELRANLKSGISQIETTTASLQKMAASFSGEKLIQSAHNVTAAVNQIGGASKLTEAEAARVNATLEKALEKYRALGKEAPAGMQQLANETRQVDKASSGLTDTVKGMAASFAAMFTARAAFNFVKSTVAEASSLKDLSQQTHINVEELQLLAGAMSEFGVDADTLAKGLFTLSRKVAGGDESVAKALETMGMSLGDLEGLNGQELFLKIERGLATLQGGLRDDTASEIFGSRLGMAMAGASEGIEGTLETWRRHNEVMTGPTVDALDQADEAIKRTTKSLSMMAANLMGPVAEGFNVLFNAQKAGMSNWDYFVANTKDLTASLLGTGTGTENLTRLLDGLNQKTAATAKATDGATKAVEKHTPRVRELTEAQEKAALVGVIWGDGMAGVERDAAALEAGILELHNRAIDPMLGLIGKVDTKFHEVSIPTQAWRSDLHLTAETIETAVTPALQAMEAEIAAVALSFSDAMALVGQGQGTMTGTVQADLSASGKASTQKAWDMGTYYGPVVGGTPYNPQGTGPDFAALGYKALGGPVSSGMPYMVGERGPELFVPERSGSIVPNGGGGPTNVTVHVHVDGSILSTAAQLRDVVGSAVLDIYRSGAIAIPAHG